MSTQFNIVETMRALAKTVLLGAHAYDWTMQGFGMLRIHIPARKTITYVGGAHDGPRNLPDVDYRLNVWCSRYRARKVSLIHDHPWSFQSVVLSGKMRNVRFRVVKPDELVFFPFAVKHIVGRIQPGPGGGMLSSEAPVFLNAEQPYHLGQGDTYAQEADEVHLSDPDDGCVSLNVRRREGPDTARVFWPAGESWVSAEPRVATPAEVADVVGEALEGWVD